MAPKATVSFYFTSSSFPFYFTPLYSSLLHSTPPYSTLLLLTSPSTLLQYSLLQIPSTLHLPLAIDFVIVSLPFLWVPFGSLLLHSTLLLPTSPSTLLQYSLLQIPSPLHLPLAIDDIVSLPFLWVPFGSLLTCFVVFIFFITFCIVFLYHNKI